MLALEWISGFYNDVHLVIDGLDECTKREQLLLQLTRLRGTNIKLFVTSQPESDTTIAFHRKPVLKIDEYNNSDILTYVQWQLENDPKLTHIKPALKQEIQDKLIGKSARMYYRQILCPLILGFVGYNVNWITIGISNKIR